MTRDVMGEDALHAALYWRARAEAAQAERDEARERIQRNFEHFNYIAAAAEARVTAHERTASLACDLLNALQPWGLQSPEVRSAATRLTVALAALTPPSEAAAPTKEDT